MESMQILKELFALSQGVENFGKEIASITARLLGQENAKQWMDAQKMDLNNLITTNIDMVITTQKESEIMPKIKEGSIRKRNDGRWETRAMIGGRQKTTAYDYNQALCIKKHYEVLARRDKGLLTKEVKTTLTLHEGLDKYYEMGVKPRVHNEIMPVKNKIGQARDKEICKYIKNIKKMFPNVPVNKLTVFVLEECSLKIGYGRTREGVDNVLCMALDWLNKKGVAKNNLTQNFDRYRHEREQGNSFSRIDQERIIEYARLHSKYYFNFMVYFNTGCRPGEIRAIRHKDWDFEKNTIFINGSKNKFAKRYVPMPPALQIFESNILKESSDKVFKSSVEDLRKELNRILEALGIDVEPYTLKSTRHSYSTRCNEKGVDFKVISKWMGHSNTNMTAHYTHIMGEFEKQQASKLVF